MVKEERKWLQSSTSRNKPRNKPVGRTIEEVYRKKSCESKTQLDHIRRFPENYVGSLDKHEKMLWVWKEEKMVKRCVSFVPGLYKIFDEILVNAVDNKQRDPKLDYIGVEFDVNGNNINVYNNGEGIPIIVHPEEKLYVPEMLFGHLLTSSHYDDSIKKTTGGRNGIGAKLTNIFSKQFTLETADGNSRYKQIFSNNMGQIFQPTISTCMHDDNWTLVSFKPDLSIFGMDHLESDIVSLMKKRVIDVAGCLGKSVQVEVDGNFVLSNTFEDYIKLYPPSSSKPLRIYKKLNERWEVGLSMSDGHFEQISFVNGVETTRGGTHVDYIINQIGDYLVGVVRRRYRRANLKAHNVKKYIRIFVNAVIENPIFESQAKERLTSEQSSYGTKCILPAAFLRKVTQSDIMKNVIRRGLIQQGGHLNIPKLEEAYYAATEHSEKCTLLLTEGDSAKALVMSGLSVIGQDYYGVFPLRGKLLNVREASPKQLKENTEIQNIIKILGLKHGKVYKNTKQLRYGHLMIVADQDHDGSHIKGLIINFLHTLWPSLLKVPEFVAEFITPVIKATDKYSESVVPFYTRPSFDIWKETLGRNISHFEIKFFKGLGTSSSKEGLEYFADLDKHKKDFVWADDEDGDAIELAFSKEKVAGRRTWIQELMPGTSLDPNEKQIRYRDFFNKEYIHFSNADNERSIPALMDGLKPSQRKVLFCAFKANLNNEVIVAQLVGYVCGHASYHHSPKSLADTIIGMGQTFVGTNNINFFYPASQYGTRETGGKDAADAKYAYTRLTQITRYIFKKADDSLLDYLNDDGQSIEPAWYAPIIPVVLVNGCFGIGTGWSTYIPNYNPRDIIKNIKRLLRGEGIEQMHPWYRQFKGTINKSSVSGYISVGIIKVRGKDSVSITELPVGRWTEDYKQFLAEALPSLNQKNPIIEDYKSLSDDTTIHFIISMTEEQLKKAKEVGLEKYFKLTTKINTTNMHLHDANGVLKKYETPGQILMYFFKIRLELYKKRKEVVVSKLEKALLKVQNQANYIKEIVEGTLKVGGIETADVCANLTRKRYTPFTEEATISASGSEEETEEETSEIIKGFSYLLKMPMNSLTYEKSKRLYKECELKSAELDELRRTTPQKMWLRDLEQLEQQLDVQDRDDHLADIWKKNLIKTRKGNNTVVMEAPPKKKARRFD